MTSAAERIAAALRERLTTYLHSDRASALVGGTHAAELRDNVVRTIDDEQLAELRAQLARGDGGELRAKGGDPRISAHAPHSSATLALNAFGFWLGREAQLSVAGETGWTANSLELERRYPIIPGRRAPNLDVTLMRPDLVLAIESKLREYVPSHKPKDWVEAYRVQDVGERLEGAWRELLEELLSHPQQTGYRHLGIEQLVKHALGLRRFADEDGRPVTLLYVYWEPKNAGELKACVEHRSEVEKLHERLGADANPRFISCSYAELFDEWEAAGGAGPAHVAELRARYGDVVV